MVDPNTALVGCSDKAQLPCEITDAAESQAKVVTKSVQKICCHANCYAQFAQCSMLNEQHVGT